MKTGLSRIFRIGCCCWLVFSFSGFRIRPLRIAGLRFPAVLLVDAISDADEDDQNNQDHDDNDANI